MKKILYVITKSNFGGAQRYVYDLASSLPKGTHEVVAAFGGTGKAGAGAGDLQSMLSAKHVRTTFIRNFARDIFLVKDLLAFFELITLFKKERPDVVHLNSSKAGGLGALAARVAGVPKIIFTAHGWPHQEPRNIFAQSLIYLFSYFTVLLSHQTIVVSNNDLRVAPAFLKRRSLMMIHNGVAATELLSQEGARDALRTRTGLKLPQGAWILSIAELTKNKNLKSVVAAMEEVRDASLVLIGSGELEKTLHDLIQKKNLTERVFMAGYIPHADTYVPAANIFILPSLKEGLPYTILEAGRAGLPVIASKVGGIPDIIEDGKNGLFIDPKDKATISSALNKLAENPTLCVTMGATLKEKIEKDFSLEQMVEKTRALY